jgi:hypothetical protein
MVGGQYTTRPWFHPWRASSRFSSTHLMRSSIGRLSTLANAPQLATWIIQSVRVSDAPHRVFRRRYSRGPRCIRQDVNSRRDPEAELTEHAIQINPSPRAIAGSLRFVTLIRRFYHLDVSGRGEY